MSSHPISQTIAIGVMDKDQQIHELQNKIARLETILNTPLYLESFRAILENGPQKDEIRR